ncbi:MAG: hypothetical protein J6T15_03885 [Bacilli bacterium]|nr:hypothetical protein [Bacilli bacterium]
MKRVFGIDVKKEDKEYYDSLLSDIKNGREDDFINIGSCEVNGVTLWVDLCSGGDNYYMQFVITDSKARTLYSDVMDDWEELHIADNNDEYILHFSFTNY